MEVSPSPTPGKRILYVITKPKWGGAQRYVYDLATAAQRAGYTVTVTCGSTGELTERLQRAGVSVISIGALGRDIRIGNDIDSFRSLVKNIRAFRPDIVHTNSSKAGGLAAVAARIGGAKKVIFTAHGWAFNEDRPWWQKLIIAFFHYLTVLLSDETICVSEAIRNDARYMPFVQKRLSVIHHGVSSIPFYEREEGRAKLAPSLSLPFWIGTIAELHKVKRIDVLLRAFAQIAPTFPEAGLVVMGEGEERAQLELLIQELDISERTILCGHVPEAARYLKTLDLFVLPSRSEALAYVLLEAGTARLPVVASNVGGIPEIIENNVTGFLVPSGDVRKLTAALSTLIADNTHAARLADALHERVSHTFSQEEMIEKTFAHYR